jgi:hypothetical protein
MKKLFYLSITLLIAFSGCEKQQVPHVDLASIKLDTFIVNNYTLDAKQLYFDEIYNDRNHFNRDNPIIDPSEITNILKLFQIVYNLNSQESNTVFNTLKIHVFCGYSFNSLDLRVDPSLPDIKNLINKRFPIGNQSLDNLFNTYGLDSLNKGPSYPGFTWLTLYTKKEFNMIPIADKFNENPSINLASIVSRCGGDGPTISLKRSSGSSILTFIYAWGDCPSGCGNAKYWEFRILDGEPVSVKFSEVINFK